MECDNLICEFHVEGTIKAAVGEPMKKGIQLFGLTCGWHRIWHLRTFELRDTDIKYITQLHLLASLFLADPASLLNNHDSDKINFKLVV